MGAYRLVLDAERFRGRAQRISRHQAMHDARLRRRQPEPVLEECRLRHSRFLHGVGPVHPSVAGPDRAVAENGCDVQRAYAWGRVQFGSQRHAGGAAHPRARIMSTVHRAATTIAEIKTWTDPRSRAGAVIRSTPGSMGRQVTDWLQLRRQEAVSKMDKFLTDASHRRACILMTCSRPVTLTFSVMQYLVPRRLT